RLRCWECTITFTRTISSAGPALERTTWCWASNACCSPGRRCGRIGSIPKCAGGPRKHCSKAARCMKIRNGIFNSPAGYFASTDSALEEVPQVAVEGVEDDQDKEGPHDGEAKVKPFHNRSRCGAWNLI